MNVDRIHFRHSESFDNRETDREGWREGGEGERRGERKGGREKVKMLTIS
jgi:hypothetical protein